MPLHRLTSITIGVPNVAETAAYYAEFGLTPQSVPNESTPETVHTFHTADGGEQLKIAYSAHRRLLQLGVGASDPDDLDRIASSLSRLDRAVDRDDTSLRSRDPGTGVEVVIEIAEPLTQPGASQPGTNGPGRVSRPNERADGVLREGRVRPRKLGHVVVGSTDQQASEMFFTQGLGFKVSDSVRGLASFMRCSSDHHNVLVQSAPLSFLHHTSWQVEDVDEVGRGASAMLAEDPDRHVWGLGRHHIGSNFFWYLKDPAGNFSEYYSDLDCIVDDQLWKPDVWEGTAGLYSWGPPPPPSFLQQDDLAALMTGAHTR